MLAAIPWHDFRHLNQQQLPASVRPWLLDRSSLTARLQAVSHGHFAVQRLSQGWHVPTADEASLLQLKPRQRALVREVILWCNDEPWIYARSVIPASSLSGSLGFLRKLQNSALGGLLFKDPFLQRGVFEVAHIQLPHANIPVAGMAASNNTRVYGRRSLFRLQQQPLLVAEFFLPACRWYNTPTE